MTVAGRPLVAAAAVVVAVIVIGVVVLTPGADRTTRTAEAEAANTARVERGALSATVSQDGILTYEGLSDGSPLPVVNHRGGTYTQLPASGDRINCGDVLYRVDDTPVVLLCGTVPTYRSLRAGDAGRDVRQLNRNLHRLRCDAAAGIRIDPSDRGFTATTAQALEVLQRRHGLPATGALAVGEATFAPGPVRVARVIGELGGAARPNSPVLSATSSRVQVRVALDPSQQDEVKRGDRAQVVLPGNKPTPGRVAGFGRVAQVAEGASSKPSAATIPTFIRLRDAAKARRFDQAPVGVDITTRGVKDALSVPVTALVGKAGGGFAVERVRADGRRELVPVQLGLFDTGGGRVQVKGRLRAGEPVVVPSL